MRNKVMKHSGGGQPLPGRIKTDFKKNYELYIMFLLPALFYLIFCYKPMYGLLMAFENYKPSLGIWGSQWVGLKHFNAFFSSFYFGRLIKNTFVISLTTIIFDFPAPIILALLLNELRWSKFKRTVQTISYLPHFISLVVICGMIKQFTLENGLVNDIIALFGGNRSNLLNNPSAFVPIYVISEVWTRVGWGSIIYLAALSGISPELYEAASLEGAGRFKQMWHVTLPGLLPTVVVLFVLRMGSVLTVGHEKIILLYNPMTMSTADVISSYVYRKGLQEQNWSFSTAVGLFNSVINLIMLVLTNKLSKKLTGNSLW